jgi:hypothetical protein
MSNSQKRAVTNHRRRLSEPGMTRYEVCGPSADMELVRAFAQRLAVDDAISVRLRADVAQTIAEERPKRGFILAALRRSPLVGAGLKVEREVTSGRDIDR